MMALSKHPKWRRLSSKDKDELKKFKAYLTRLDQRYEEAELEAGKKLGYTTGIPIERPDFLIIAEVYEEIYG
jgi:hypothetical protein